MEPHNPFEIPKTNTDDQPVAHISILEYFGILIASLAATGVTFFATCFGSVVFGSSLASLFPQDSGLGMVVALFMMFGLPILTSAWVLIKVNRSLIATIKSSKEAELRATNIIPAGQKDPLFSNEKPGP